MPDLNIVSPFTIEKSYQIMNEFAKNEFNVKPQVAWMIDCFGHPGIMPRLARQAGLKYYVFWRGMLAPESTQEFIWTGTDGSPILTHWMKRGYSLFGYLFKDLKKASDSLNPSTDIVLVPFGADFYVPEEKLIRLVHKTENAKFALPSEFFEELEKYKSKLPTIKGEMLSDYDNFRGYYSSRVHFKKLYRKTEKELLRREASEQEWKDLLYAAFHDIICGTGIDEIYPPAEKKLKRIKISEKEDRRGNPYKGKFLDRISFELRAEEGDLYHTIPSIKAKLSPDSVKLRAYLKNSSIELWVKVDFNYSRHVLKLIIDTGIRNGMLLHHFWRDVWAERSLNTLYAFNGFFEYKEGKHGIRFYSDDCFDYEVKDNGRVYLTLVRGVQILSHGDAGPKLVCPKALELGEHNFRILIFPEPKEEWI